MQLLYLLTSKLSTVLDSVYAVRASCINKGAVGMLDWGK